MNSVCVRLFFSLCFVTLGCASGICRHVKNPELANAAGMPQPASSAPETSASPSARVAGMTTGPSAPHAMTSNPTNPGGAPKATEPRSQVRVFVFKADGGLQCGQGKALSPQEMQKQLRGIEVFSAENRGDGMMHIQMCGAPTGMINVFEIPLSSLPEALQHGFKKLEPRS